MEGGSRKRPVPCLILAAGLLGCAVSNPHDIRRDPGQGCGLLHRTWPSDSRRPPDRIRYDKAMLIRGVFLEGSRFRDTSLAGPPSPAFGGLVDSLVPGDETYLFVFRNHVGECCDGFSASSFPILARLADGRLDPGKTIVIEDGFQVPHDAWIPGEIR